MPLARATLAALTFLATAVLAVAPSSAQERIEFGPFYVLTNEPEQLYLDGPIGEGSAQALIDNLDDLASVETLVLNSAFGTIVDGLVIAEIVRSERVNTFVPAGAHCGGPCFFIFMAGIGRTAYGTLSADDGINEFSERFFPDYQIWAIENEVLAGYGASDQLLALFWGLRGNSEHRFTPAEINSLGLYRSQSEGTAQVGEAGMPPGAVPPPLDYTLLPTVERTGEAITAIYGVRAPDDRLETTIGATIWARSVDPFRPIAIATTFVHDGDLGVNDGDLTFIVSFVPSESRGQSPASTDAIGIHVTLGGGAAWPEEVDLGGLLVLNPDMPDEIQPIFTVWKRDDPASEEGQPRVLRFELQLPRAYADVTWQLLADERFTLLSLAFFLEDGSTRTLYVPISDGARSVFLSFLSESIF